MDKIEIETIIISLLKDHIKENDLVLDQELNTDTRLIGSSGFMDSMDLVSFLVELEETINDKYSLFNKIVITKEQISCDKPIKTLEIIIEIKIILILTGDLRKTSN